ncbi:tetratricopeptide repeat protein [uncultured Bradyrhizobium sp.]|jgi:type II protein arginine methyltransferase|uniref:tetratricopeptide repeat protein n=1 Tax=uncultured Bradyrhizobium sp. TaxID=199684 RepID=UPI0026283C26|nr:tetratricopeptide repeat protein [uncultured Bradyrhizobium sp.]
MSKQTVGEPPDSARRSLERGMQFHGAGNWERAEQHYLEVLLDDYRSADVLPLLAIVVANRGHIDRAIYYWDTLLSMEPHHLNALAAKGGLLYRTGRLTEALSCFEIAAGLAPDDPLIRNNLAVALADIGRKDEAIIEFGHVLRLQPDNVNAYHQLRRLSSAIVPFWHIAMMNDTRRNDCFERAIRRALAIRGSSAQILDIGTGSGLLSMMAAREGATNIVTCETVPTIARVAREIVADNGYGEQIKVIGRSSTTLSVGEDIPTKADILISEILSSDLLAEDVLSTFEDARRRLIAEDAIVIPKAATAIGCLVASETLAAYSHVKMASGFDVSRFNSLAPLRLPVHGTMTEWTRLSNDFEIASLNLTSAAHEPELQVVSIPVIASGTAVGVVQWMHVDLIDEVVFTNHPDGYHDGGWLQVLHVLPRPMPVEAGSVVDLLLGHDRSTLIVLPAGSAASSQPPSARDA